MTTQNLFEKYGIKEVADVTIYRIEKKEQTYESQREINVKSVLKGAVELRTVYPMEGGLSIDDGFEAYVFSDASLITGINYDCDDLINTKITIAGSFEITEKDVEDDGDGITVDSPKEINYSMSEEELKEAIVTGFVNGKNSTTTDSSYMQNVIIRDSITKRQYTIEDLTKNNYELKEGAEDKINITYTKGAVVKTPQEGEDSKKTLTYTVTFSGTSDSIGFVISDDLGTGVYEETGRDKGDLNRQVGTHEYTYAEQAFMLFAKRQNLITKTGTRYRFLDIDNAIAGLAFEDAYALAPNSAERVVVLGPAETFVSTEALPVDSSWSSANYDYNDVNELMNNLTQAFMTKAYDVKYDSYAELVVEDEMGYFNPKFLGTKYSKATKSVVNDITENYIPEKYIKGVDMTLKNATMWGEDEHYSINDAIDALRQQQKILDADDSAGAVGVKSVYGGYKVTGSKLPTIGSLDTDDTETVYKYSNGEKSFDEVSSTYKLSSVLDALASLAYIDDAIGKEIEVTYTEEKESNRAIYVDVANANAAAKSFIYLLHNKNYRQIATDTEGVFTFNDKRGNRLYYQDKIFAGTEWLALVIIGTKGLMFVVNRHGDTEHSKIAWMVSDNGFITDKEAKVCVGNGLIHTIDIVENDETFEVVCPVKELTVRKVVKNVNRYVPVLFLDTLKISTLEQTAEEVYATGGRGNSNLIGWDYGKEITLTMQDALFTPASLSAVYGSYEGSDFRKGVKDAKIIDRMESVIAKRNFIVPAGNQNGVPTEADKTPQAVFIDPNTMEPYQDGTPIAEGERFLKFTRSTAYDGQSIGKVIEISADKFPGTYKIVGDTYIRSKETGEDQRFQFIIPMAKMTTEQTITLEADGDPAVFDMNMTVLRPDDGVMVKFVQYDVVENEEENDGSTMVKDTENLNLLDNAELYKMGGSMDMTESFVGATEY